MTTPDDPSATPLRAREREVLALMAAGMTNDMISQQLGIGLGTVKTHVKRVFIKLRARNRSHAVALAIAQGIIAAPTAETDEAPPRSATGA